jgi:O-antigen ligase
VRSLIFAMASLLIALLAGYLITQYSPTLLLMGVFALIIFTVSFINIEWGLYILIFSMLLSPEIITGHTGAASLGRGVTLRLEDFLLAVIGLSWLARNAVDKELGLFLKTPLNKAILFYVLACVLSTGFGIMAGRVELKLGSMFVLKYIEYFIVFFMMVNHVRSTDQVKRFIICLFITCFIASIIGALQIPGGGRVSAPFEGEIGEPNTFGGYLLFMGCVAGGLLAKADNLKMKQVMSVIIICIIPSFLFTQSRTSYVAIVPALLVLGYMTDRRLIILGLLVIALLVSPLFLPKAVKNRIMFTFTQPEEQGQIKIGDVRLDTSTSARIQSWKGALRNFPQHPLLGHGVTGYQFIDAQFPRVLVETGILGLISFLYLLYSIFKLTLQNLKEVNTPFYQGLGIGFLAGFIGLVVHSMGANTFIIVRIMEPFWFFVGIITVLPMLERQQAEPSHKTEVTDRVAMVHKVSTAR